MVVLSVLYVVSAEYLDLANAGILLPLQRWCGQGGLEGVRGWTHGKKVNFFEEFLFVVFEFADHCWWWQGRDAHVAEGVGVWVLSKFESAVDVLVEALTYLSPRKISQISYLAFIFSHLSYNLY